MDSDDEFFDECPICYEEIDIKDSNFKPCLCSFKICYFCYDRLVAKNEPCPACRREYKKEYITYEPISEEKIAKYEAKKRKELGLDDDDKKFMRNARITQYNLVYIQGLPEKYANIESLKKHECFGRYGKITKLVFANKKPETDKNGSLYITYSTKAEAENAIREIHNHPIFGGITKASFGTTKYCKFYLRKIPCPNSGCLYLHDKQLPEEVGTNAHSTQSKIKHSTIKNTTGKQKAGTLSIVSIPQTKAKSTGSMLPKSVGWAKGTAFSSHENDSKSVLSQSNEFPDLRAATTTKPKVVPLAKKVAKAPATPRPTTSRPETIPSNDSEDERFESEDETINESNPVSGSHEDGDSEPLSYNNENIQPSSNKATDPTIEENKASSVSLIDIEKVADVEITARLETKDVEEGVSSEDSIKEMPAGDNKTLEVVEEAEGEKNVESLIGLKDTTTIQRPEFNRGPSPRSSFSTLKIDDIRRIDFPRRCAIHYFKDDNNMDDINPILERGIDQLDYRHINTPESLNVKNIDLNQDIIISQNNTNYAKEQAKVIASIKFVERIIDSPNPSYDQSHMFEVQPNLEVGLVNGREEISLDELFQIATPMPQIPEHQYTNGDEEVEGKNQNREQVSNNINLEQYQNINSNSIETEQPLPPNHSQNFRYMHPGNSNNPVHMLPNNYISMDNKNQHQNMMGPHNQGVMNSIEYQNRYNYNQNVPVDQNVKSFEHIAHRPEYKLPQGNEISGLHPSNIPMHPPLQRPYYPMVPPNQGMPHGYIPRPAYHGPMAYPLPRPNVIPIPPQLPPMNHMPNHPFNGHIQYPSLNNMYMNPNQMHNYGPHNQSPRLSGEGPEGEEDIVDLDNSESQESKVANIKKEELSTNIDKNYVQNKESNLNIENQLDSVTLKTNAINKTADLQLEDKKIRFIEDLLFISSKSQIPAGMPVQDFILAEVVGSIPHYKQTPFSSPLEIITILKKVVKERLMPQINFDRYNFTIPSNDRIMLSINQITELTNLAQVNNSIDNQNEVRSDNERVNGGKTEIESTLDNLIQDKTTMETSLDSAKDLKKKATFADKVLEHRESMKTGVKNKATEKTILLRENESVEALNKDESKIVSNEEKIVINPDIKSKEESGQKKFKFTSNPLFEMNFKPTLTTLETPLTNEQLEVIYNGLGSTYDYLSTSLNTLISTDKSLNNLLTPTVPEKKKDSLQNKSDKLMVLLLKKEEEEAIYQYFEVDASKSELLLKNNKFRKDVKMFRIDALKILAVYEAIASTFQNILMIEIF